MNAQAGFLFTDFFTDFQSEPMTLDRVEALLRLGFEFEESEAQLEFAE